jgi:hypothetical protein
MFLGRETATSDPAQDDNKIVEGTSQRHDADFALQDIPQPAF